jgi:two-component system, response regulator
MTQPDVTRALGQRLKAWRKRIGLSQEKLAERADLHRSYLAGVESGARNPSFVCLHKLARALGISLETFFSTSSGSPSGAHLSLASELCPDILLIEPDEKVARSVLRVFDQVDLLNRVILIQDAAEALDYTFRAGRYSDQPTWRMPGLILLEFQVHKAAAELIERIKAEKSTSQIPVILLASSQRALTAAQSRPVGGQGYWGVPFEFAGLQQVLAGLDFNLALVR